MASLEDETRQRDQARLRAALAALLAVTVVVVAGLIWAGRQTGPADEAAGAPEIGSAAPPAAAATGVEDVAAQRELVTRSMLVFPDREALPQTLSTRPSGPPITVPAPTRLGPWVAEGFPPTPEGAIGQLAALLVAGLRDANPETWSQAYRSVSLPGAPAPGATPLGRDVATLHAMAVTSASDPSPLSARWQPAGALIKGETDGGRFVVACVLGEMQAIKVNAVSAGTADCQAMRWTGRDWRISPGPAAARAPRAWPGSEAAVQAGYRPLVGAVQ